MVNLNCNNKKGFTLVESIIGFFLLSSMLLLYLPAHYNELYRMEELEKQTNQWRIFNDLVSIELNLTLNEENQAVQKAFIIELWESEQADWVEQFYCDDYICVIYFGEANPLYVEIEYVNE